MNLKHLHLHVRNRSLSQAFYGEWLGLTVARSDKSLTFMSDGAHFALALMSDPSPAPMPSWFHFGFAVGSGEEAVSLHDRMQARGVRIVRALYRDENLVSFRCADPDQYVIEIYWEGAGSGLD
jgi:catechol 2,3-dioxygenase-like lactoylglutathione lyase family enzyme